MGDVIKMHPPGRLGHSRPGEADSGTDLADQLREVEKQRRDERAAKASAIADRLQGHKHKLAHGDAETIAGNLSRILDQAKAKGVDKQLVCEDAGMGAKGSSKRLDTYVLPDRLEGEKREERARKLTRKARGYLKLAQACAKRAKWDENDTILSLVAGSSYDDPDMSPDVPAEYWSLARTLEVACKGISKRYALDPLWTLAERHDVTECIGHWKKDREWHYYNGFEAPAIRLGFIAAHLKDPALVPGTLPLRCTMHEQSGGCEIGRVVVAAGVHLCLARWADASEVSPFLGFAPALIHTLGDETELNASLSPTANLVTDVIQDDQGNVLGTIVRGDCVLKVEVAAAEIDRRGVGEEIDLLVGWHKDLRQRPWEWLPSVTQLRAPSLYRTLGSLHPIFVNGEWLAPGDHPTLCLEPAAAALERAIVAPETVRRRSVTDIASVAPPAKGWRRGVKHIGPIEELLLRTKVWSELLRAFISETTAAAALALEEVASRYEPALELE